jgi:hypothetical protein
VNTARDLMARQKSEGSSRYRLSATIATGGMAVIRRGFDTWAQRDVAHKRLRVDGEANRSRATALFQREFDTLARLKHPNIVEVYDYGFDEHGPYYAMELLSGDDLAKVAPLPYRDACRVLRDVASALALVHARHFVHRDVSPNNVRLTSGGVAKLLDFGTLTPFGRPDEIAGTAAFIAPECLSELALDQRADLYSLGALAYWTLTKRTPFPVRTIADLEGAFELPPTPPSGYVEGLPLQLDELVLSLLSRDRDARPSSAGEVIERLSNIGELPPDESEPKAAYSYLKHPPLIGRETALSQLRAGLESALSGHGQLIAVEAAAGLGKSALLDQFAVDAQLRGATVLRAEGSAHEDKLGMARRLIQLGTLVFPDLEGSEAFNRSELGNLSAPERVQHPVEALERGARSAARLRNMLLRLSARSPLVLLLDDADRADEESLGLLASMAAELDQHHVLLVLTRQNSAAPVGSRAYQQLTARARQVALQSLEEAQVVALIDRMFGGVPNSGRTARWLYGQSGGNPAQCIDLLRLLMQHKAIRYARGNFTLPHDIDASAAPERRVSSLLARLTGLSADADHIFKLLCLHQGSLGQLQLASASGLDARRVLLAVEQLVQRELAFQRGAEVSLRGESMRAALEQSLAEAEQQALHRALARVMREHGGGLADEISRARHLFRSGNAGELEGAELIAHLISVHGYVVSTSAAAVPLLESALSVFAARGVSELHCAPLLAALSAGGFYGNIEAQAKYLRRALTALSQQCGFVLARRLRPKLGAHLALLVGLMYGLLLGFFLPRRLGRTSIKHRIEDFMLVAATGVAAASVMIDAETASLIVTALEPAAAFPARFAPSYSREFCLATADLTRGETAAASVRYGRLLEILHTPVFMLDERLRTQLMIGCLHGRAWTEVEQGGGESLVLADQMEQRSAFFAPHAETVRVGYHSARGQHHLAEVHRARAETLALRGGASWTAASVLAVRSLEPAMLTNDAVGLLRAVAELERLAKDAPSLERLHQLALAQLALVRGRPREAELLLSAALRGLSDFTLAERLLRTSYAHTLNHLERYEEARRVCLDMFARLSPAQVCFSSALRVPHLPWVHAEAALGHVEEAERILSLRDKDVRNRGNPLELGLFEAEYARLSIRRRDVAAFDQHFAATLEHFSATSHPALSRQCAALLSGAIAAGIKPAIPTGSALVAGVDQLDDLTAIESRPQRDEDAV